MGGAEIIPEGSLQHAFELFPDEQRLAWLVAEQFERRGESEAALGIYIGCLPLLIDARERERIEGSSCGWRTSTMSTRCCSCCIRA